MSTRRPVVGIVGYHHAVPRPFGELPVSGAPTPYVGSVAAAGGLPVLLPQEHAVDFLGHVDAVVLTGGGDVDPLLYGADRAAALEVDRVRDEAELAVLAAARDAGIPVLAICRGMQLLAVAYGGALRHGVDHVLPETGHAVRTAPGSVVRRVLGPTPRTSALHHQAVADPGAELRATAWAEDGTIEALEPLDPRWQVLGVQWHPEMTGLRLFAETTGPALFAWLVEAARGPAAAMPTPAKGAWFCR